MSGSRTLLTLPIKLNKMKAMDFKAFKNLNKEFYLEHQTPLHFKKEDYDRLIKKWLNHFNASKLPQLGDYVFTAQDKLKVITWTQWTPTVGYADGDYSFYITNDGALKHSGGNEPDGAKKHDLYYADLLCLNYVWDFHQDIMKAHSKIQIFVPFKVFHERPEGSKYDSGTWTQEDQITLSGLNKSLFKGESFVEFTDIEQSSAEYIHHAILVQKYQRIMKSKTKKETKRV